MECTREIGADLIANGLKLVRLRFTAVALSPMDLGGFPGSTLRSALGARLRELVCITKLDNCTGCAMHTQCAYPQLFETTGNSSSQQVKTGKNRPLAGFENAPKPYVIHFPGPVKQRIALHERFTFDIILFGQYALYVPHLVQAIQNVQHSGLGKHRKQGSGRFVITALDHVHPHKLTPLLDETDGQLKALPQSSTITSWVSDKAPAKRVNLKFLTPLRLRKKKQWVGAAQLEADDVIESVCRRVSLMAHFYGTSSFPKTKPFKPGTHDIVLTNKRLRWSAQNRYSARQKRAMPMDGIVGDIELSGTQIDNLIPWLQIGALLHIGKGATMGMGQYTIGIG